MGDFNGGGSGPPKLNFGGFGGGASTSSPGFALGGAQAGDKPSPFAGFGGTTSGTASPFGGASTGTPAFSFGGASGGSGAAKPTLSFGAPAAPPGGDSAPKPAFGFGGADSKPLFGLGSTPSTGLFGAAAKQQNEPKPLFGSGAAAPERATLASAAPVKPVSAPVAESAEIIKPTLAFMEYEPKESAVWTVLLAV